MFGLDTGMLLLLFFCIACACAFEFVNGFHDTANAVATVIYTNSLKPNVAVVWSGFCNFVGVLMGGVAVAMGVVNLLPLSALTDQSVAHSVAMILSILFSAIIWNLGTWYYGLPASSSHTLVGAIIGVGLAYSLLPGNSWADGINLKKAADTFSALLIAPVIGFSLTVFLMYMLKRLFKKNAELFKEPLKDTPPPFWIRAILVLTCTGISYAHGSNDGQKGVGIIMIILIGILPTYFAVNTHLNPALIGPKASEIRAVLARIDTNNLVGKEKITYHSALISATNLARVVGHSPSAVATTTFAGVAQNSGFQIRKDILLLSDNLDKLTQNGGGLSLPDTQRKILKTNLFEIKKYTDYSPIWVTLVISLSLGIGTMVGWKRIVTTIGEKIGKTHLTYAQGASAELVAASTIGFSSVLGLPVSTTHVLSSGIAGSMVASSGIKNLQAKTVRNILAAWILTLPVSMLLSGSLFLFFRWVL